ncbi:MAG: UDP-N-acetylmuramoyl-tripeptide--D-alanyl-D-alanine ligase, partial [Elusimicrobia bacterium]|nr:UDP-N-acetylmuramoyl-tripeptide--D-alanyl-D-alanine ligase [Elusimicrobiota bacterium]
MDGNYMNLNIDLKTLAEAINGKIIKGSGNIPFNSFETDFRKIKAGDFLLALKGKKYNAHDFLQNTLSAEIKGWIINEGELPKFANLPDCVIAVEDTLKSLHKLASFHRNKFDIPLISVTGSNGKTTVKQMIYSILSQKGLTCANKGNFNNQYGLPFSLLELNLKHKFGVFELGASRQGDIEELGAIAKPNTAIITNIAPAHLEFFGDIETIY